MQVGCVEQYYFIWFSISDFPKKLSPSQENAFLPHLRTPGIMCKCFKCIMSVCMGGGGGGGLLRVTN